MKISVTLAAAAFALAAFTPAAQAGSDGTAPMMSPKPPVSYAYGGYPRHTTCARQAYRRCMHRRREPNRIRMNICRREAAGMCSGLVHTG